jgi:hypothetical protein
MTTLVRDVERMILQFFQGKDNEERKTIKNGRDVHEAIDEESIEEIKTQVWDLLRSEHIRWHYLADAIKDMTKNDTDEETEEDTE